MLLAWTNRADTASLRTDSEKATLPSSNVQQPHLSRQWHTAAGVKSAYLILDLGSSLACSVLAVLGTNLTSTTTIQVRASDTDPNVTSSLAYDSGSVSAGVKDGYGAIYKAFDEVTARYWRLDIADSSLPDNLHIGRVFLGPSWEPSINQLLGTPSWQVDDSDSKVTRSYGGQSYPEERPAARLYAFELGFMSEAEMFGNAFALARAQGTVRDVLAISDPDSSYLSEQGVFGLLQGAQPLINNDLGVYRQKFTIRERL